MEVSCRVFQPFFVDAARRGVPFDALVQGTGCSVEQLRDVRSRVSWQDTVVVLDNAQAIWGDSGLVELGAAFIDSPVVRSFSVVARLMFDTREFYRWVNRPRTGVGNQLFTCVVPTHEELAPDHIRVKLRMQEGYPISRPFFTVSKGALSHMPRIVGAPRSDVRLEVNETGGVFDIRFKNAAGLRARLKRVFSFPANARIAAQELAEVVGHATEVEVAHAARERVLAGIHHDMRGPLQLILISAAGLRDRTKLSPETREQQLHIVKQNVRRLAALVDGMLDDPTRRAAPQLHSGPHDVAALARETVLGFRGAATDAGVELIEDGPPTLVAEVDAFQIERALANLVSNALKFTPTHGRVVVSWAARQDGTVLAVRDSGVGVDDALKARLFQSVVSGAVPIRGGERGLGLGLTIVRDIAAAHGGTTQVDDAEGGGAVFSIRLPRTPAAAVEHASP